MKDKNWQSENQKNLEKNNERNSSKKVKSATLVEGDPKAPFSSATIRRCRGEGYSIPWSSPLYP